MKKFLFFNVLLFIGLSAFSQISQLSYQPAIHYKKAAGKCPLVDAPVKQKALCNQLSDYSFKSSNSDVSIITLGGAVNAYSYGHNGGQRSFLDYNADLHVLIHAHRMGGISYMTDGRDLGYDVSFDDGANWHHSIMMHPYYFDGYHNIRISRYPQAVIFNPFGNTAYTNAYTAFFAPFMGLDFSPWNGYANGLHRLGGLGCIDTTRNADLCSDTIIFNVPESMSFCRQLAKALVVATHYDFEDSVYLDQLVLGHGAWDENDSDVKYTYNYLNCPTLHDIAAAEPVCARIAFAPNSPTGYIVVFGDNGENEAFVEGQRTYHPIVFKTTDGGQSWSAPTNIQLDGPNGIPGILTYLSAAEIDSLFSGALPARDEIPYTTAFDFDLVVDKNGNPHIATGVSVAGAEPYSYVSDYPYNAVFDIWSPDGGATWEAVELGRPKSFRGDFGNNFIEDNRVCAATNWDGDKIFVTWLDTDPEVMPGNNTRHNVWARAFDPMSHRITANQDGENAAQNITAGTEAENKAWFATLSTYVIHNGTEYELPISFQDMDPEDVLAPVRYHYIRGFAFEDSDFIILSAVDNLYADFSADKTKIEMGGGVHFYDFSYDAASYFWTFEGGEPQTSTEKNPHVTYNTPGDYDVGLTISNGRGEATKTIENYVHVYDPASVAGLNDMRSIFPNPTNGMVQIKLSGFSGRFNLELWDNTGRIVCKDQILNDQNDGIIRADFSGCAPGIYVLKLKSKRLNITKKIILK